MLWQVVDTTCPAFECSLSFQKSIFWFLIAGLPVTLAIAWVHWQTAVVAGIGILAGATVMFFVMRGPASRDHLPQHPRHRQIARRDAEHLAVD